MRQLGLAALGLVAALLGGCASREQIVAEHRAICENYGFSAGSEAFASCLLQLDISHTPKIRHHHRGHWPG